MFYIKALLKGVISSCTRWGGQRAKANIPKELVRFSEARAETMLPTF